VTGQTRSPDYPTTSGAFDRTFNGGIADAFVSKLNASGSALAYSTFLGGTDSTDEVDQGLGIAVRNGTAYVTGESASADFPTTTGAFDRTFNGGTFPGDAFVTKLNASGSALAYSTFLGGTFTDRGESIAVDGSGRASVTGFTVSTDFPTTSGAFDRTFNGEQDAFVSKLNASGSALAYSTFLGGGNADDAGHGIAVAGTGRAYVTGGTSSPDFPTTSGAFDTTHNGLDDAFVTKLPTG
jgi:hypothetical protein